MLRWVIGIQTFPLTQRLCPIWTLKVPISFFVKCVLCKQLVTPETLPWTFLYFQKKHSKQDTAVLLSFIRAPQFGHALSNTTLLESLYVALFDSSVSICRCWMWDSISPMFSDSYFLITGTFKLQDIVQSSEIIRHRQHSHDWTSTIWKSPNPYHDLVSFISFLMVEMSRIHQLELQQW